MPIPTTITDLSQTAASNYPQGSDSPATLDDTQRAHGSFIAQLRDGKGFTNPIAVASASTVDIGGQNSQFVEISGTTTITSLGTTYNGPRFLRFTGALILTHNSTTLNLPSGANVTTTAGYTCLAVPNQALTGWNIYGLGVSATTAKTDAVQTFTAAQRSSISSLTDGATITPDFSLSNTFQVQLGGNRTLGTPTNLAANQTGSISVFQDKTGSRTLAYAWPYVWAGGTAPALTTAGASEDQLVYQVAVHTSSTATLSIATPCIVTMTAHGFVHGQRCQIATTGALPTGLAVSTTYFIEVIDANSFYLCTTRANVAAGTRIATSGSQSGTHTLTGTTIRLALNKAFA